MKGRYTEEELKVIMKIKEKYESIRQDDIVDGKETLLRASNILQNQTVKQKSKSKMKSS